MKIKDLIKKLQKLNPDSTICLGEKQTQYYSVFQGYYIKYKKPRIKCFDRERINIKKGFIDDGYLEKEKKQNEHVSEVIVLFN
jgi:hypothetical protein